MNSFLKPMMIFFSGKTKIVADECPLERMHAHPGSVLVVLQHSLRKESDAVPDILGNFGCESQEIWEWWQGVVAWWTARGNLWASRWCRVAAETAIADCTEVFQHPWLLVQ